MREVDHDTLRYEGGAREQVTVRVTAQDTVHLVTYKLDGAGAKPLAEGQNLSFKLKTQSGARTDLQLRMDFTGNGRYDVLVSGVDDCQLPESPAGKCLQGCLGPDGSTLNFKFFVE